MKWGVSVGRFGSIERVDPEMSAIFPYCMFFRGLHCSVVDEFVVKRYC